MFAAEYEPAELGRRRSVRAPVSLDARIGKTARTLCRVVDVSTHGVRLQTYSALTRGGTIWLILPGIGPRAAKVMWADDFAAGCQFLEPLDEQSLDKLVELDAAATRG